MQQVSQSEPHCCPEKLRPTCNKEFRFLFQLLIGFAVLSCGRSFFLLASNSGAMPCVPGTTLEGFCHHGVKCNTSLMRNGPGTSETSNR